MKEARRLLPYAYFFGYKQGQELVDWYHNADVFVFPSGTDTFGLVMIEAMAQGTPVAAFPVQGPVDVIDPGLNGFMDWNLKHAVELCLTLDRDAVKESSEAWCWRNCWSIFQENLIVTID